MAFLASCTTAGDPAIQANTPAYNSTTTVTEGESTALAAAASEASGTAIAGEPGDLPQQVAATPSQNPAAPAKAGETPAANALVAPDGNQQTAMAASAQPGVEEAASPKADAKTASATKPAGDDTSATAAAVDPATAGDGTVVTAAAATAPAQKKQGFLASFFAAGTPNQKTSLRNGGALTKPQPAKAAVKPAEIKTARASLPLEAAADEDGGASTGAFAGGGNDLPGVRKTALFEIKRRSGLDDDADVDIYEEEDGGPVVLASAAGMARLAPNGLLRQTESVDVACLKPSLVRALKQIERHYGKKMVVTSGYRSPSHNRRARGAKNSLHMYCAAADIQVPGVGKWELANYVRTMPGRGGIGTYCHTNSIHVDVGPERDWNWRCRGRRK